MSIQVREQRPWAHVSPKSFSKNLQPSTLTLHIPSQFCHHLSPTSQLPLVDWHRGGTVTEQALTDERAEEAEEGEIFEDQDTPPHSQDGRDKPSALIRQLLQLEDGSILGLLLLKRISQALRVKALLGLHVSFPTFSLFLIPKPPSLPPLDAIGIEPLDHSSLHLMRRLSLHIVLHLASPARQASISLGFSPGTMGKGVPNLGNFGTGGASKLSSEDRFAESPRATSVSGAVGMQSQHPMALTRTVSTGGPAATRERERTPISLASTHLWFHCKPLLAVGIGRPSRLMETLWIISWANKSENEKDVLEFSLIF